MLEALISEGGIFKRIIESIKDLVTDANLDCSSAGISLQAMDSSRVSLVSIALVAEGFDFYRADKTTSIGINMSSLAKVLKCAGNDDAMTIRVEDGSDHIDLMFESKSNKPAALLILVILMNCFVLDPQNKPEFPAST